MNVRAWESYDCSLWDVLDVVEDTAAADCFGEVACIESTLADFRSASYAAIRAEDPGRRGFGVLVGSSILLMVPATKALDLRTINSKPSFETRVTNSEAEEAIDALVSRFGELRVERFCMEYMYVYIYSISLHIALRPLSLLQLDVDG